MHQRFFGDNLFGVFHSPRGNQPNGTRSVLICPPIGQEFIRTHWCLRLLANQLSRRGIHVLRMDYRGIGDSIGDVAEIENIQQWNNNIRTAVDELKRVSGSNSVMLMGLRFGASLAIEFERTADDVNSLVLWEPIIKGRKLISEWREMHARMLDLWVCRMETEDSELFEEILGSRYKRSLLQQIESVVFQPADLIRPHLIVETKHSPYQYIHDEPSLQKVVTVDDEYSWDDLNTLETAWLRPKTTRQIAKTIDYMFGRLDSFSALQAESPRQLEGALV